MSKRQKFVLVSVVLSIFMFIVAVSDFYDQNILVLILGLISFFLCFWSLRESLLTKAAYLSLILPVSFTLGVGFFYFLLPEQWLIRLPIITLYGVGVYALLLTANIYTVASIRTIALARAAQAVGYVLTLFTLFLLYDTILSFRLYPWSNAILVVLVSLPLYLQGIWSSEVSETVPRKYIYYSIILSLVVGEITLGLSLWPVTVTVGSLFLTTMGYILLGISQQELTGRLFRQTIWEYLAVGGAVFITMFLTTRWGG